MQNSCSIGASALPTPSAIIQRFVRSVESGDVRSELAEDCILCLFGRSARGAVPATGFMRTHLLNRFNHVGFQQAKHCEPPQVTIIKERFGRTFDRLRREMCKKNEMSRATTLHLRAESDDEDEKCATQLFTPPRSVAQDLEELQYVEANGVLEAIHGEDGGIELGDKRHVILTVAFRCNAPGLEICLIIYDNYKEKPQKSTLSAPAPRSRFAYNANTDDESDDASSESSAAPRSVRRKLFAIGSNEEDSAEDAGQSAAEASAHLRDPLELPDTAATVSAEAEAEPAMEPSARTAHTPRKRHHDNAGPDDASKRPTGRSGMRF